MTSAFRNLFDALISALGGGFDKPRMPEQPPPNVSSSRTPASETCPPKPDPGQQYSFHGFPIDPEIDCHVCGLSPAKPEYYNQFCSYECEQRLADSMDAWHDQFQERFGDD